MKIRLVCLALMLVFCTGITVAQQSADETAVWNLEHTYWDVVKAHDLVSYRALWHADFVGWPQFSATPLRKEHITDWMNQYTSQGLHLKTYFLEPAASHATGDIVVTYYRLTANWVDKSGSGKPQTSRITHTWLRTPKGWQILGGMSAPEPVAGK